MAAYDGQLTALVGDLEQKQLEVDAMTNLYLLQQAYSAEDYESCAKILQTMEAGGQVSALEAESAAEGVASPYDRFYQLKDAVEAQQAQTEPAPAE